LVNSAIGAVVSTLNANTALCVTEQTVAVDERRRWRVDGLLLLPPLSLMALVPSRHRVRLNNATYLPDSCQKKWLGDVKVPGTVCSKVLSSLLSASGESVCRRLQACVRAKGGHFEHLL